MDSKRVGNQEFPAPPFNKYHPYCFLKSSLSMGLKFFCIDHHHKISNMELVRLFLDLRARIKIATHNQDLN